MGVNTMSQAASDEALTALVEGLYEDYYTPVLAYVCRLVDDVERAHELVQETFLRLYRERTKLRSVENRRAWVYRIATNVTFRALRRRSLERRFSWQLAETGPTVEPDPTARVGEAHIAIEQALAALPLHYRAPLLLHSYCGFPIRDTATVLALSETAVTTRIYRAKKMFREAYEQGDR
jgi:RNA polymerase sigma factor (sigma-70 family)